MLQNRYGNFDASGRAFTVTDPRTPMPWCNVVCNGRYGFVVSHNGGGFSWFDDAQHNVLTRWEMDLVRDCYGKFLYVSDLESGDVWSLAPAPCRPSYDRYACTHTLGKTTFSTSCRGIDAEWTMCVAPADSVELWSVRLTNTSGRGRRVRLASYFEWTCGVAPDVKREFHRLFFKTDYDARRRAAFATKVMWDIRPRTEREHWNQPWPYHAAHSIGGAAFSRPLAIGDKSAFLGRYGSTHAPAAMSGPDVREGLGFGRFGDASAALGGDLELAPGQSVNLHYTIAIGATRAEVEGLIDRYRDAGVVAAAIAAAGDAWAHRLSPTRVQTAREDFDLLNNHWLPYQAISGRLWGRTGYYQQSGAFGYRDQLQDSQVWLPIEPKRTADQIMLHAERQFADGSVYHWWHALADFGNHTACSDDYLWLPFLVSAYIRETGDATILQRTAKWVDDATPATIAEHCRRSIARTFARTSERGLPLIGSCDWNDGLSAMGIDERGESVWLGMFLCEILDDWAEILSGPAVPAGLDRLAEEYRAKRAAYAQAINEHAWEGGGWYRYGTKDSGEWVGAASSPEGKVHLNAQTWAILADIAPRERAEAAWTTVKERLLSPYGPLLLWPAYTEPDPTIGYVTRYCPGSRENGGVYMHAATWALAAACKLKDRDAVERIWDSISPAWRGRDADAYWAEPYVTPGNVDGPLSDKPGRAGWTWYTGSAAWLNRVSMEWMLGVRPVFVGDADGGPAGAAALEAHGRASHMPVNKNGHGHREKASEGDRRTTQGAQTALLIDPCPPASLGKVRFERTWRGHRVRVSFDAGEFAAGAEPRLTVNGQTMEGQFLTESMLAGAGAGRAVVEVEVRWTAARGGAGAVGSRAGALTPAVALKRSPEHGSANT
ncbi:MAG: glycosyl transferase family 36 [Phycisphaerales bacterium]